jgi:hypothetical protein
LGEFGLVENGEEERKFVEDAIVQVYGIQRVVKACSRRIPICTEIEWVQLDDCGARIAGDLKCWRVADEGSESSIKITCQFNNTRLERQLPYDCSDLCR